MDLGLLTGLAEGVKGGLEGYDVAMKRKQDLARIQAERELKQKMYKADLAEKGLKEAEGGLLVQDEESPAFRKSQLDEQYKRSQVGLLGAQEGFLRGGKQTDMDLFKAGMKRDPITNLPVPDPTNPNYAKIEAENAEKRARGDLLKSQKEGQDKKNNAPPKSTTPKPAKITVDQRAAATFAQRLEDAERDLTNSLDKFNPTDKKAGLLNRITPQMMKGEGAKLFQQARDNFINAVLRRESGAAISPGEYATADRQYFPLEGDTPEVLAQKARNRAVAKAGLLAAAGEGAMGEIKAQLPPAAAPQRQTMVKDGVTYEKVEGGWQKVKKGK